MTDTVAGAAAPAAARTAAGSSETEPRRQPSPARPAGARAGRRRRGGVAAVLGLTPFASYVVVFLAVPTLVAVGSGFFSVMRSRMQASAVKFGRAPLASHSQPL